MDYWNSGNINIPLSIKYDKKNSDFRIYVKISNTAKQFLVNKTVYLQHILNENRKNTSNLENPAFNLSEVYQETPKIIRDIFGTGKLEFNNIQKVIKFQNDTKNFKYYLSLRGFLLFLLGSTGISNSPIHNVIKTLMENKFTKKDYPFLLKSIF